MSCLLWHYKCLIKLEMYPHFSRVPPTFLPPPPWVPPGLSSSCLVTAFVCTHCSPYNLFAPFFLTKKRKYTKRRNWWPLLVRLRVYFSTCLSAVFGPSQFSVFIFFLYCTICHMRNAMSSSFALTVKLHVSYPSVCPCCPLNHPPAHTFDTSSALHFPPTSFIPLLQKHRP